MKSTINAQNAQTHCFHCTHALHSYHPQSTVFVAVLQMSCVSLIYKSCTSHFLMFQESRPIKKSKSKPLMILAVFQLALGILLCVFNIAAICVGAVAAEFGAGLWVGVLVSIHDWLCSEGITLSCEIHAFSFLSKDDQHYLLRKTYVLIVHDSHQLESLTST